MEKYIKDGKASIRFWRNSQYMCLLCGNLLHSRP